MFRLKSKGRRECRAREHTTESVPTSTRGGDCSDATISAMKFAVMPMIEMRHTACIPRATVKEAPRAPNAGPAILTGGGDVLLGFGERSEGAGSGSLRGFVKTGGGGEINAGGSGLTGRLCFSGTEGMEE